MEFFTTLEEKNIIDEKANSSGLDRSKYLRKVALQQPIINIDMSYLDKVVLQLNKIGTNINQIAKHCNGYNVLYKSDIQIIKSEMNKIMDIISDAF